MKGGQLDKKMATLQSNKDGYKLPENSYKTWEDDKDTIHVSHSSILV